MTNPPTQGRPATSKVPFDYQTEVFCEFAVQADHHLPNVPAGHKCGRMHGHEYRFRLYLGGAVGPETGWIVDYAKVREVWMELIHKRLDHNVLNAVPGLENPTSENLALWVAHALWGALDVTRIEVRETCTAGRVLTLCRIDR